MRGTLASLYGRFLVWMAQRAKRRQSLRPLSRMDGPACKAPTVFAAMPPEVVG